MVAINVSAVAVKECRGKRVVTSAGSDDQDMCQLDMSLSFQVEQRRFPVPSNFRYPISILYHLDMSTSPIYPRYPRYPIYPSVCHGQPLELPHAVAAQASEALPQSAAWLLWLVFVVPCVGNPLVKGNFSNSQSDNAYLTGKTKIMIWPSRTTIWENEKEIKTRKIDIGTQANMFWVYPKGPFIETQRILSEVDISARDKSFRNSAIN